MTPPVIDTLARLKDRGYLVDDDDLVFCNSAGEYLDSWALRRRYYKALDKAGLRKIRFHDLRHCFGSAAITKLDAYAVQSYMGHQHYSTSRGRRTPTRSMRRPAEACPQPCPEPNRIGTN